MKWKIVLLLLLAPVLVQADNNTSLILALNEPDKLIQQRQAAVERLKEILAKKKAGVKLTAELPVTNNSVVTPDNKIKASIPAEKKKAPEQPKLVKSKVKKVPETKATEINQNANKYLFVVLAERQEALLDIYREKNDHQYTRNMARQLVGVLYDFGIAKGQLQVVNDYNISREYNYESNEHEVGNRLCAQKGVDKIVTAMIENDDSTSIVAHDATFLVYNCKTKQKLLQSKLTEAQASGHERVNFSSDMKNLFRGFLKEYKTEILNES